MEDPTDLEDKKICRICLTQDEETKFFDIFSTPNLQIELLSIGSIEVFQSDGMPKKMCEICRKIIEKFYKFKQICRRSDTMLRMYPINGNIPQKLKIPPEILEGVTTSKPTPESSSVPISKETRSIGVGCEIVKSVDEVSTQTDHSQAVYEDDNQLILLPQEEYHVIEVEDLKKSLQSPSKADLTSNVKILNKSKSDSAKPPKYFKKPTKMKIGNVEIKPVQKILNSELKIDKSNNLKDETIPVQILKFQESESSILAEEVETQEVLDFNDGPLFACEHCDKTFPLLQQLDIHKLNHERARDHPCSECDKSFFTKYDLGKHILTHTQQRDYTCVVCSKSFSRSTLLYRHEKIHTDPDIPRYNCKHCDRVYLNSVDCEKHALTHSKSRPFQCKYCDKSFVFKQGLDRHETIHDTKSMQFTCQYCDYKFPTAAQLQRHLSSDHIGIKKFPCRYCAKRFTLSHHLHRHLRNNHKNEEFRSYQCSECEDVMSNRAAFFSHCEQHAEATLSCPLCKDELHFSDCKQHIQDHANSNVYLCDHCSLVYISQEELDVHFAEHGTNDNDMYEEEVIQYIMEDVKTDDIITYDADEVSFVEYIDTDGHIEESLPSEPPTKKSKKSTQNDNKKIVVIGSSTNNRSRRK